MCLCICFLFYIKKKRRQSILMDIQNHVLLTVPLIQNERLYRFILNCNLQTFQFKLNGIVFVFSFCFIQSFFFIYYYFISNIIIVILFVCWVVSTVFHLLWCTYPWIRVCDCEWVVAHTEFIPLCVISSMRQNI